MTADKYRPFESKLENMLKGIDARIHEIKGMVAGLYDRFGKLVDTAEATYRTVSYHDSGSATTADEDWDFLDEEE